ncbi:hypothetical protein LJC64_01080 [Ruminococcaceae bacterium OttesenSCG-928-A11]|nr:hypothetical protein [Ruminococcaceae bacterium OttesenSCG-928-A11]
MDIITEKTSMHQLINLPEFKAFGRYLTPVPMLARGPMAKMVKFSTF